MILWMHESLCLVVLLYAHRLQTETLVFLCCQCCIVQSLHVMLAQRFFVSWLFTLQASLVASQTMATNLVLVLLCITSAIVVPQMASHCLTSPSLILRSRLIPHCISLPTQGTVQ